MSIFVPTYASIMNPFEGSDGSRVFEPIDDSPLPEWVKVPDWFYVMSCKTRTFRKNQYLTVKFVPKPAFGGFNDGFVKVFPLMKDGSPFPHMNAIYSLVGKHAIKGAYSISDDGEIRDKYKGFPSENNVYDAIVDISSFYDVWQEYPSIGDWELVKKLEKAKAAVIAMYQEEAMQTANKEIARRRQQIREEQDKIAEIEGYLNEMYEEAADGMNLLEENGIDINTAIDTKGKATT